MRGEARVARPGVVSVGDRELEYDELVVATGSKPAIPPIDGLEDVHYWTNRDAVWATRVPVSLIVLGGGAVGVELAQFFGRMGADVTLVEHNGRLLAAARRRCRLAARREIRARRDPGSRRDPGRQRRSGGGWSSPPPLVG